MLVHRLVRTMVEVLAEADTMHVARQRHVLHALVELLAEGDTLQVTRKRHVHQTMVDALAEEILQSLMEKHTIAHQPTRHHL